ncbi:MAG: endonuclease/exonuclease/phosphatase family protein [Bacteroidota bacterium]|jgi:endonuclease/exonuclease/phosphatase family metal-dependent hydrolase|nr:endonuclease/exonuclease/phosphatase family protein [Bacteroidota bacterium]
MNPRTFILFLFFLASVAPTAVSQENTDSSGTVRILSFNIYHGATMKGDFDLDHIAGVIKAIDPDLVALQEVDFMTRRARGYDLATELGWRTKKAPLFGRAMPYDGGEYGEAILSRYSFIASRNVPLPYTGSNEPRAALMVTTVLPAGDTVVFIGTHFDHTGNEADRVLQARKVNELLSWVRYPVILAGDLNAEPGSTPILILEEQWGKAYDVAAPSPTFPSDVPEKKIDYVMYYPKDRWKVISSEVVCDAVASDHCALLVTLELLSKPGKQ